MKFVVDFQLNGGWVNNLVQSIISLRAILGSYPGIDEARVTSSEKVHHWLHNIEI